ncbi:MAG: aminopeptidase, partial [Chthoniobacteraceae bacterium]
MNDPRFDQLAKNLVGFSISLRKGDRLLIDAFDIPDAMVIALVRAARAVGALPFVHVHHMRITREIAREAQESALDLSSRLQLAEMKSMQAYIALRGGDNALEMSDVPVEKMKLISRKMKSVLDWRVQKTRWCVLRWPSSSMAQMAQMSTEA